MGLEKAKSLLVVKDGRTFLDLIALQVGGCRAQLKSAKSGCLIKQDVEMWLHMEGEEHRHGLLAALQGGGQCTMGKHLLLQHRSRQTCKMNSVLPSNMVEGPLASLPTYLPTYLQLVCCTQIKHMRAAYDSRVRFILMNSFSTSDDTRAFLQAHHPDLLQASQVSARAD